ncbi:MAG: YheT family hydrolase [Gammaproteobacteria bacterium]
MSEFKPPGLLRGPHAQSIVARVGLRRARVRSQAAELIAASEDIVADVGDGVRLLVHHTAPRGDGNGKLAVLLHGWEGSATATYVLSVSDRLWREGYRIVRINLRDHGDSHHLNEELFHSCRLDEVIGVVRWAQREFPRDDMYMVGSSLGGNFALRVAAGASDSGLDIRRVVAICPVLDPEQTMHALDHGSIIYQRYFMHRWRMSLERKKAAFPQRFDFTRLERFNTLEDMTDYFVRHYTEYSDLTTYLRGYALTEGRLEGLTVPSTMLLAKDDPVIPVAGLKRIARPDCLRIETTTHGGHCGFISDLRLNSWADQFVMRELELN